LLTKGANRTLSDGIKDLGGATIDLAGGDYIISSPLIIPQYYGNFVIQRGTIRATSKFPTNAYLIQVGGATCENPQKSCNQNIGFNDLMLDCGRVAAGAMLIKDTMGANVGPRMFILAYTVGGITVVGGHEVMIHESWLGEFLYSKLTTLNLLTKRRRSKIT
jgi:hypothetical protein